MLRDQIRFGNFLARVFRPDDRDGVYAAVSASIPELARYETWCRPGYSAEEALQYVTWWIQAWEEQTAFYFVLEDLSSRAVAGVCGLSDYDAEHRHADMGYWIRSERTGRGIATAAARSVARAGFEDLDLVRIGLEISVANAASCRVAEKLGAVREGVLRNGLILPDGVTDLISYSLIPGELTE